MECWRCGWFFVINFRIFLWEPFWSTEFVELMLWFSSFCVEEFFGFRVVTLLGQVIWGSYDGDFKVKHQLQDVKRVLAAGRIFVAIHSDGTCTVVNRDLWQLRGAQPQQLCASDEKYALVLADGDVLVWDDAIGSPANRPKELAKSLMSKRVIQLQSTTKAFCAVFSDGEAIAFGDPLAGGDSGSTPLTDVKRLEASDKAFAALYENGTVAAWGHPEFGGDCSAVQHQLKDVQQSLGWKTLFDTYTWLLLFIYIYIHLLYHLHPYIHNICIHPFIIPEHLELNGWYLGNQFSHQSQNSENFTAFWSQDSIRWLCIRCAIG